LDKLLEQSGLQLTLRQLGLYMAVGAAVVGTLAMALGSTVLLGLLALPAGAGGPLLYVAYRRNKRLEKMRAQLPDTYDLMARIIRSGQTMSQALQAVADEFEPPVATEFAYCFEQQNLGLSSELALRDLARRTSLVEIKIFVLGLLVQQQTGGNLAELLEKLALVIRARFRIRGKIKTLTAEGRLQAIVLLALPFVVFLLMLVLNWDYTALLLEHPGILAGTFLSEVVGAVWIRKIVNFDY
jgi:tight adherence protein B